MPPRLLRGERQDRRHQLEQRVADQRQRGLRRTPRAARLAGRVEAVLQHVEVEPAEVLGAEGLQPLRRRDGTRSARSRACTASAERARRGERVAVDLEQLVVAEPRRSRGIEIRGVREQEAQRVADAPVAFDDALQDLVGDRRARPSSRSRPPTGAGSRRPACSRPSAARRRCPSTSTSSGLRRRRRSRA